MHPGSSFWGGMGPQQGLLPSPLQHTMVKQLLKACKHILGTRPKNRKTPLTAAQAKELVLQFGGWNAGELQMARLIALGFTAFLCWDDLKDLRCHNLHMTSDHMSITLTKRKNDNSERVLSSWQLAQALVHALFPWLKGFYLLANIRSPTISLERFAIPNLASLFVRNNWLTQGLLSCLISNSKSSGSTPSNMGYTVSGQVEHPLQPLLQSQTGYWCVKGAGVHRPLTKCT